MPRTLQPPAFLAPAVLGVLLPSRRALDALPLRPRAAPARRPTVPRAGPPLDDPLTPDDDSHPNNPFSESRDPNLPPDDFHDAVSLDMSSVAAVSSSPSSPSAAAPRFDPSPSSSLAPLRPPTNDLQHQHQQPAVADEVRHTGADDHVSSVAHEQDLPIAQPYLNHDPLQTSGEISTSDVQELDDDEEQLYFQGLSYPPQALDWCTLRDPSLATSSSPSSSIINGSTVSSPPIDGCNVSTTLSPYSSQAVSTRICSGETDFYTPRVEHAFVNTFRQSSPYIYAHQGLVFVLHIPGELLHEKLFASVMEDIALMQVVGIKLVLVLGPQGLVNRRLAEGGRSSKFVHGIRVTDLRTLQIIKELAGSMRFEVECAISKGVSNMPSKSRNSAVSGSFYSAKPLGIVDGEDFGYTGKVRRIDVESINRRLDQGDVVVMTNVGSSPSGQHFNCKAEEVASECAAQLKAEKLIFMGDGETLYDRRSSHTIPNLTLSTAERFLRLRQTELPSDFRLALECSVHALQKGVRRAHILNRFLNGVLLMEVFHRDGVGLMVSRDQYEGFRRAQLKDVNGIKAIIRPLEEQGILKPRSRASLERVISKFVVIERDGMIIACMSLMQMEDDPTWAELGCVAVHRDYRKLGKGDAMLGFTERMAYDRGVRNLFVLSTQSFDWFYERGFKEVSVDDLPNSRQAMYDRTRKSKIFHKVLQGSRAVR